MAKISLAKISRTQIHKALVEQLRAKGADVPFMVDLVRDYMELWGLKERLTEDIKENGLRVQYMTAGGGLTEKDNPSVKLLPTGNRQMLSILSQLDISTDNINKDGADFDEL